MALYSLKKSQLKAANSAEAKTTAKATDKVANGVTRRQAIAGILGSSALVIGVSISANSLKPTPVLETPAPLDQVTAPAEPVVVAPTPAVEDKPETDPAVERYVDTAMLKAARNMLERCQAENDQGDVLGYAACEKQRELYEYARTQR
jgi:hypothetical protein